MFFTDMMISNILCTDFLSVEIKNPIMYDNINEIQWEQLYPS